MVGHAGASCRSFVQHAKRRDHRDTGHGGNQFAYIYPCRFLNPYPDDRTSLSLTIKPPLSITTTSLPDGNIGAVYGQPVQTVGGFGPLTFSIVPGTGTLPPGFSLNTTTGVISGTATATGNFPFTVRVADTSGQQDTQAFTIIINPSSPPSITTPSLPAGTLSRPYNQQLQAAAGIGPLTWSIPVGSLPPGLTIVPPPTGPSVTISGTPTSQGTFNFTVRVTDTLGQFATRALSITINLPAPPNITTTTLPAGTINQTYNQACAGDRDGTADLEHRPRVQAHSPRVSALICKHRHDHRNADYNRHLPVHRSRRRHFRTD